jgi:hypothetical protein
MKTRNGFVSNSSSSSFIIRKENLTEEQKYMIHNHYKAAYELVKEQEIDDFQYCNEYDSWSIDESEKYIYASTIMDNFPLGKFLEMIGVTEYKCEY